MSLTVDPEIAAALAPMAESDFAPPTVGDIAGRRASEPNMRDAGASAEGRGLVGSLGRGLDFALRDVHQAGEAVQVMIADIDAAT